MLVDWWTFLETENQLTDWALSTAAIAAKTANETIKVEAVRAQLGHNQRQDTEHVVT